MNSPQQHLMQLLSGYWNSQCLYVVAKLGIADLLAERALSVDELAAKTGVHRLSLYRVLRAP